MVLAGPLTALLLALAAPSGQVSDASALQPVASSCGVAPTARRSGPCETQLARSGHRLRARAHVRLRRSLALGHAVRAPSLEGETCSLWVNLPVPPDPLHRSASRTSDFAAGSCSSGGVASAADCASFRLTVANG